MATESKKNNNSNSILEVARRRFDLAVEAETDIRKVGLEDLKFSAGEQWPDEIKRDRELSNRPCLTINKVPQHIRQVTNDQRQNRPAIQVNPVDDQADVETAKIYQGIIRHIEYSSNADTAYDTAFDGAVRKGWGYWRVVTEYTDPLSFDQEIKIKRIKDHFSVYVDPYFQEPDGSDMKWAFVFEDMPKDDYKEAYKDSDLASMDDWASIGSKSPGWVSENSCRVAEYFYEELEDKTIYLLSNGEVLDEEPDPVMLFELGLEVVNTRKTQVPVIKWCKINGVEVLEKGVWIGRWIPIVPVLGDELDIEGKRVLEGLVRHAKDPQRMYNYWASAETETITLAPKAPFIGAEGQFEGHESKWRTANTKNHSYLEYKPKTVAGQLAPPPQRNVVEPPVMAITNARMQSGEDLKSTTGIYDASLGNRSNETSGVAIQRRNVQAQTSNFHFIDNLTRSLKHTGRILVDIIPKIYDTARVVRIIGEDEEQKIVRINDEFQKENGEKVKYDISKGKYDVTVATGPSYTTKRQEATESMIALSQHNPKFAEIAGDLMVKNMDWPGAQEIAERLKKTLPPGLVDDEKQPPIPPQVKGQMDQMNQMIEQLTEKLNEANEDLRTERLKIESDERIAFAKLEIDMKKELLKAKAKGSELALKAEIDQINRRLEQDLNFNEPVEYDFNRPDQPETNQNLTGEVQPPGTFVEE